MTIVIGEAIHTSLEVSTSMFGGNNLFLHNLLSGEKASFPEAVELLGVSGLRFPGGTMTEVNFDIDNPDGPPLGKEEGHRYVGITEFLAYALEANQQPTIVLPTERMYAGSPNAMSSEPRAIDESYLNKVLKFVRDLLTRGDVEENNYPDAQIQSFEIGNEYWGSGNMTAKEYGQLVNALVPRITEIFDELIDPLAPRPTILIQMGNPWDSQYSEGLHADLTWGERLLQCNKDIIDQITDPLAQAGIGGLIEHYYYGNQADTLSQNSASNCYIDVDLSIWENAGFNDLELIISEWGVAQDNSAQYGLRGASVIMEQMEHMIRLGVDSAFAWPIQGWRTSLAGDPNSDPELTPVGAAFQIMSETIVGTELYESGASLAGLEVNTFGSNEKTVVFVMSRSDLGQMVSIDLSSLTGEFTSMSGVKIGVEGGVSVSDPTASALLTYFDESEIFEDGMLRFFLNPYEVMTVQFDRADGKLYRGTKLDDNISAGDGNDTMLGNIGNDTLEGGRGDDNVRGSFGADLLNGWRGSDRIFGGSSGDFLFGKQDDDFLRGGVGGDVLGGEDGSDVLSGGSGSDLLFGGIDSDTLSGGSGRDTLDGGDGADVFVLSINAAFLGNLDTIIDFEVGVDLVELRGIAKLSQLHGNFDSAHFDANTSGMAIDADDRIIYETDTGILWLDVDGSRVDFDRRPLVQLDLFLDLTATDFVFH